MKRIEEMSLGERLYFPEVLRGLTEGKEGLYDEYVKPYRQA